MVYTSLAPIYDRVMSHVDYGEWLSLIRRVIRRYSSTPNPSIFEIGGGTGKLGEKLRRAGYTHVGSDLSFAMCREAIRRGRHPVCADGRRLPVKAQFGLFLFLYDGINYLLTAADFDALIREVHRCLTPGGLFLFDITTEANSRRYFVNLLDCEDFGDVTYIRRSYYDELSHIQHNDFVIFVRTDDEEPYFQRFDEQHVQRVLRPEVLRSWIPSKLFDVLGIWDGFSFRRYTRTSDRIHFLLRAKGGEA